MIVYTLFVMIPMPTFLGARGADEVLLACARDIATGLAH
jgi:hypothetical protein